MNKDAIRLAAIAVVLLGGLAVAGVLYQQSEAEKLEETKGAASSIPARRRIGIRRRRSSGHGNREHLIGRFDSITNSQCDIHRASIRGRRRTSECSCAVAVVCQRQPTRQSTCGNRHSVAIEVFGCN